MLERDVRFAGWSRPAGWTVTNLGRCRGCGAAIAWCRTTAGRHAPLDRDGTSHFATCPQADTFRRTTSQKPHATSGEP
jgi:hypothetical protein